MTSEQILEELERKYNEAIEEGRKAFSEWFYMSPEELKREKEVWNDVMRLKGQRDAYLYMIDYIKQKEGVKNKIKTSKDFVELVNKLLEESNSLTEIKLPNGSICSTDVGYVESFWHQLLESLDD